MVSRLTRIQYSGWLPLCFPSWMNVSVGILLISELATVGCLEVMSVLRDPFRGLSDDHS